MIQIDMQIPKSCRFCPLHDVDMEQCPLCTINKDDYAQSRYEFCPLQEVATDEDTVSRKQAIEPFMDNSDDWVSYDVRKILESLPPSPSRPKGEWINNHTTCSKCGWQMIDDVIQSPNMVWFNFCPHCGADMRTPVDAARDIVHKAIDNSAWSDTVDTAKMHKVVDDKYAEMTEGEG